MIEAGLVPLVMWLAALWLAHRDRRSRRLASLGDVE